MDAFAESLIGKKVSVITNDGKYYVGTLKGVDQKTNVVLTDCVERIFSQECACESEPRGVMLIRGDNLAVLGELDFEADSNTQMDTIRASPLKPIVH
mmetsp:Transcript_17567/g.30976  ORF Transcript_17567/g.30976 Transcript_17567/m.30976 type:complete len:97 (-) Transcript_17567:1040-1330(-)